MVTTNKKLTGLFVESFSRQMLAADGDLKRKVGLTKVSEEGKEEIPHNYVSDEQLVSVYRKFHPKICKGQWIFCNSAMHVGVQDTRNVGVTNKYQQMLSSSVVLDVFHQQFSTQKDTIKQI